MLDLHYFAKDEVMTLVKLALQRIETGLKTGAVKPNVGNGRDHIIMIICGAGKHSSDRSLAIKFEVRDFLERARGPANFWRCLDNGVFFVKT